MGVSCTAWTMRGSSGCQLVRCSVLWTIQDDVGAGCLVCFEAGCFESRGVHKATSRWPCSASISMHVRISSYGRGS
ncbi:hypothetical protein V6N13_017205 [Hibiscus sabdariffa]